MPNVLPRLSVPSLCPPTAGTTGPSRGLKQRAGCRRAGKPATWCAPARLAAASTPSRSSECRDGHRTGGSRPQGFPPWGDGANPHPGAMLQQEFPLVFHIKALSGRKHPDPEGWHLPIQGGTQAYWCGAGVEGVVQRVPLPGTLSGAPVAFPS